MNRDITRARYCRILLALYMASVALVCCFILFEVLDVDGSDFAPASASVEGRPVEAHHDELKRAILASALTFTAHDPREIHREIALTRRAEFLVARPVVCCLPSLTTRVLLPRAAPGDGPSA